MFFLLLGVALMVYKVFWFFHWSDAVWLDDGKAIRPVNKYIGPRSEGPKYTLAALNPCCQLARQFKHTTYSHTHTQPFFCSSGICPGLPGWAGTRKVKPGRLKPIWIYWSKRWWVAVASAGLYMQSLHLIPDNHANIPPLSFFTGRMLFLPPNQQHQSNT